MFQESFRRYIRPWLSCSGPWAWSRLEVCDTTIYIRCRNKNISYYALLFIFWCCKRHCLCSEQEKNQPRQISVAWMWFGSEKSLINIVIRIWDFGHIQQPFCRWLLKHCKSPWRGSHVPHSFVSDQSLMSGYDQVLSAGRITAVVWVLSAQQTATECKYWEWSDEFTAVSCTSLPV